MKPHNSIQSNNYSGVAFEDSNNNIVSFNEITLNRHGLFFFNSNNNNIYKNNIKSNNEYAICLNNCGNNIIYHNNFIKNPNEVYDNSYNYWYNSTLSEGNYWDAYPGKDDDGDGIGDDYLYIYDGDSVDKYPLMNPYGEKSKNEFDYLTIVFIVVVILTIYVIFHFYRKKKKNIDKKKNKKNKGNEKLILWDFYTKEDNVHFDQQEMTLSDAEQYAKDFNLRFEEVKK